MVSRRHALQLGAAVLAGTAGCLTDARRSTDSSVTPGRTLGDAPVRTPGNVPTWTPEWTMALGDWQVLGLDIADGRLFATLSEEDSRSAIAAIDPDKQSVRWQTEFEGEAVGGSHATYQQTARDQWGDTLTEESIYTVAGPAEERQWSAVHALDKDSGERRWSFKRERELTVAGVLDGLVIVTGLEFFPPPGETPVSHQTPESPLSTVVYGLDAAAGTVRWRRDFLDVQDVAVGGGGVSVAVTDRLVRLGQDGTTESTYERGPATSVAATADRIYYLTGKDAGATLHGIAPTGGRDWRHDLPVEELLVRGDRLLAGGDVVVAVDADGTVVWRDDTYGQWLLLDPDRTSLYTRAGVAADRAAAYSVDGSKRWVFNPPSDNAWPEMATEERLVVTAITGDHADEPFYTVYAVNADGEATAARGMDTVFDAATLDGTVYLADGKSNLVALVP